MRDLHVTTIVGTDGPADDSFDEVLREMMRVDTPPAAPLLAPGLVLDDAYRIEAEIGRGGMGRVYRAHDIRLERDVAIKVHVVFAIDGKRWSLREASALARLSDPNVVTVYEVGTFENHPWVAMEYVPNGTARTWARAADRSADEILAVYLGAARGLAAAHAAGIVHRDFKPDNVLMAADGRPRVADFGLALQLAKTDGNTANLVMGTPAYMAPEQWNREPVGTAADQFAFATSLWEALTGHKPHRGKTEGEIRAAWMSPPPPPARPLARHVEAALRRALAIAPADRWPDLRQLIHELERDPRRTRRRVAIAVAASVVLAGGGAFAASSLRGGASAAVTEAPCLHATESFATVTKLRTELPATTDQRALAALDAWMGTWRTNRARACEDTFVRRTQAVEVHELRALCFDRARVAAELTLPEVATSKDPESLVTALPRLAECDDVARMRGITPLPADPIARAEIESISTGIPRIHLLIDKGDHPTALAQVQDLLARARKTERKALIAELALLNGIVLNTNRKEGVREMFNEGAKLAAEAGDDYLVAKIWMFTIDYLNARQEKPAEADKLIAVAEAAVLRAGNTGALRSDLQATLGQLDSKQGRFGSAKTRLAEAIKLYPSGEDSELARLYNVLGFVAMNLSDYDGARAALANSARILQARFGPKFRHLAVVWTTLGQVELDAGNLPEARKQLERALALKEEVSGKDSPTLVPTLSPLAKTLSDMREYELALQYATRAIELSRATFGPEHQKTLDALLAEATILLEQKNYKLAEERLLTVKALQEKLGAIPPLDMVELELAEVYVETGRYAQARAAVERARPISAGDGGNPRMQARVQTVSDLINAKDPR